MLTFADLDEAIVETTLEFVLRSDLLNLCLTCHALLPLARRRLFRHIVCKDDGGQSFIPSILRVIQGQQNLASCVRTLELLDHGPDPLDHEPLIDDETFFLGMFPWYKKDSAVLTQPLERLSDELHTDLISQLQNLRQLKLGIHYASLALKFNGPFNGLHTVAFVGDRHLFPEFQFGLEVPRLNLPSVDPQLFDKLFRLPTIANLDLAVPCSQDIPMQFDSLPSVPSLSSLVLRRSVICPEDLTKLLARTPSLKKFHLDFVEDTTRARGRELLRHLQIGQLCKALLQVSDTLEDLKISVDWADYYESYGEAMPAMGGVFGQRSWTCGPKGHMDSLRHFECLKYLQIAPEVLLGFLPETTLATVLPPQLQQLQLTDDLAYWNEYRWDENFLYRSLWSWMQNRWETTPFLERLILRVRHFQTPTFDLLTDQSLPNYWGKNHSNRFYEMCSFAQVEGILDVQVDERKFEELYR